MSSGPLDSIFSFLALLRRFQLHFDLHSFSQDCIMVIVSVPGERWEVEFFEDGCRSFERFVTQVDVAVDEISILRLVEEFGDA